MTIHHDALSILHTTGDAVNDPCATSPALVGLLGLLAVALLGASGLTGCAVTSHATETAPFEHGIAGDDMVQVAATPGPVTVTRIVAADWAVDRAGLINLDHPEAEAAGLEDGDEPIEIVFYAIEHPTAGRFLVDSGVSIEFADPETAPVSGLVASAMNMDALDIRIDMETWLGANGPIDGVFLTHLHLDHVMGLPAIPNDVPVYVGEGETEETTFLNLFVQGTTDDLVGAERPALQELRFRRDRDGRVHGVLDLFGDGSVFALHVPGHTAGSTAFLVRTPTGPELIVGDASHTVWGWDHGVEPGQFSNDGPRSVESLAQLKALEDALPGLVVHLGHQHRDGVPCGHALAAH